MTNKMKLPSILALIVIIFLSLGAVSASDSGDCITDLTNSSDSAIDDTIAISNSNNDLTESFNDSNLEIDDSNDLDDETVTPKESNKLGSSYEDPDTLSAEPIIIDSSSYSQYFDSNGIRFQWKDQIRNLERWRYNQNQKYFRQDIYNR